MAYLESLQYDGPHERLSINDADRDSFAAWGAFIDIALTFRSHHLTDDWDVFHDDGSRSLASNRPHPSLGIDSDQHDAWAEGSLIDPDQPYGDHGDVA